MSEIVYTIDINVKDSRFKSLIFKDNETARQTAESIRVALQNQYNDIINITVNSHNVIDNPLTGVRRTAIAITNLVSDIKGELEVLKELAEL